jgi:hypothetical protein
MVVTGVRGLVSEEAGSIRKWEIQSLVNKCTVEKQHQVRQELEIHTGLAREDLRDNVSASRFTLRFLGLGLVHIM